jgi:hypothetical protein
MNKYHSKKTRLSDGTVFDSRKEARRWQQLRLLESRGEIQDLKRQVEYELVPNQYEIVERYSDKTGKRLKDEKRLAERRVYYVADFVYTKDGETVVEDTKSPVTRTKDYIIKRKLMRHIHGIVIREI